MREVFTLLYSKIVIAVLLGVGIVAIVLGRLRRRLRVHPDQRSHAPILWLVNVTGDARLHRRLRRLAADARSTARGGARHRARHGTSPSQRLAIDLEAEVVNLDERLLATRDADSDAARTTIRDIRSDADRIEMLIERVGTLVEREANDPSTILSPDPLGAITARVEELEEDHRRGTMNVIDAPGVPATQTRPALDSPS